MSVVRQTLNGAPVVALVTTVRGLVALGMQGGRRRDLSIHHQGHFGRRYARRMGTRLQWKWARTPALPRLGARGTLQDDLMPFHRPSTALPPPPFHRPSAGALQDDHGRAAARLASQLRLRDHGAAGGHQHAPTRVRADALVRQGACDL